MVNKYTSVKTVIAKVMTDLDLKEETHRISDFISWIAEAIEKISAFPYFVIKATGREGEPLLELKDYQCALPNGCHRLIQLAYADQTNGPFYPMRYSTGTFDHTPKKNEEDLDASTTAQVFSTNEIVYVAMDLYELSYDDALAKINSEPTIKSLLMALLAKDSWPRYAVGGGEVETTDYTYVVNGGYIKTNKSTGYLMAVYQAIPLDIDGYPLIPDEATYIEALYWYVTMKLLYPQWKQGTIRDAVYYEAKRSWNYCCKQAYGNLMMPSTADELESIKNTWLRLIPDLESHKTFYTKQGQREQVYNQDSPRYNSYYEKVFHK
jgi:hypothetical protein